MFSQHSNLNIIGRHPIVSFIAITWIISYLFGVPFNMLVSQWIVNENEVLYGLVPRTITVYGPAIAAIIVTACTTGRYGIKTLLTKLVPSSGSVLLSFIIVVAIMLITFFCFLMSSIEAYNLVEYLHADGELLLLQFIGQFVIVGIGEEVGWRGWLLPQLLTQVPLFKTSILMVLIWGTWHLPIFFSPIEFLLPWIMILVSISFIMMWLYIKAKGNVFVLAITHAAFNAPVVFIESRLREKASNEQAFIEGWHILGYVYFFIAFVLFVSMWKLWTQKVPNPVLAGT